MIVLSGHLNKILKSVSSVGENLKLHPSIRFSTSNGMVFGHRLLQSLVKLGFSSLEKLLL
jgi:hypothetical protein